MTIVSLDLLLRGGRFVGSRGVGSRLGEFARICRRLRSRDSFRNRPYRRLILLCLEENEGMSEVTVPITQFGNFSRTTSSDSMADLVYRVRQDPVAYLDVSIEFE